MKTHVEQRLMEIEVRTIVVIVIKAEFSLGLMLLWKHY